MTAPADPGAAALTAEGVAAADVGGDAGRRELAGWALLAVLALGLAGLWAVVLVMTRLPRIQDVFPALPGYFHKALVTHVVFSFVVWFQAVMGGMMQVAVMRASGGAPRFALLGRLAVLATGLSCLLLFVPAIFERTEASLNNYVPVIIHPLYYAGLLLLACGLALAVVRLLLNAAGRPAGDPFVLMVAAGAVIYLAALLAVGLSWWPLRAEPPSYTMNEHLFWSGGHLLQFVNVAMMLAAWYLLAAAAGRPAVGGGVMALAALMVLGGALWGLSYHFRFDILSGEFRLGFTNLQYALAPPVALVFLAGLGAVIAWARRSERPLRHPAFLCLVLSVGVFGLGGVLGLFVDGADTRTPSHYHGVIGGITVAFMGVFYAHFLPLMERAAARGRLLYVQVFCYAFGQALQCVGLFWAGGHGTPRKTAGAEQGLMTLGQKAGMALNGIGGLIAIVGGILFVWIVATALLRRSARAA